jgi:malate dehydrogenase (oxaloacetate-decarboxylating)(NADP+)
VAEAAIKTGVARREIKDLDHYSYQLSARLDPSASLFQTITTAVRAKPKRVVFAEGEDEAVIRAAFAFQNSGLGKALLVGRADVVRRGFAHIGLDPHALEIRVPLSAQEASPYIERLYKRLQRRGVLYRDAVRMVTNDRNIYAASMLAAGDVDAMVTGVTRNYAAALTDVRTVIDASHGVRPIGMQVVFAKGRIVLVADTSITELPNSEQLADIAIRAAATARKLGLTPRVAMLASSNFGFPRSERSERIIEAVHILDNRGVDFEYDGEVAPDVALDRAKLDLYPFSHLTDTANVLIMPAMHSAQISTKLLQQLGGVNVMGPLLVGLEKSVQITPLGAKMSEIFNAAIVAAYDIND